MADLTSEITLKERELFAGVTVTVQIKRDLRVRVGLWVIKVGVWLVGAQVVEEFPMSLLQDGKPVEMHNGKDDKVQR